MTVYRKSIAEHVNHMPYLGLAMENMISVLKLNREEEILHANLYFPLFFSISIYLVNSFL